MPPPVSPADVAPPPRTLPDDPPSPEGWPNDLAPLRAELDRIDNALHDLLMPRAEVVGQVAASASKANSTVALRPGREAAIIRRLLGRHRGRLPKQAVVRLWRELLAATTAMQGPFSVAVCETDPGRSFTQAAREQFGALTPLHIHPTSTESLADLRAGTAQAAVLSMPTETESAEQAWWTALLHQDRPHLYVVGRLPFWSPRAEGAPGAQALVVAAIPPDPSGSDRSLIGLEPALDTDRARLAAVLADTGLAPLAILLRREPGAAAAHVLVEVEGYLTEADPRLAQLAPDLVRPPVLLGGYAIPVSGTAAT